MEVYILSKPIVLVLIFHKNVLQLFNVSDGREILLGGLVLLQMPVIRLLVVGYDPQDIIHLVPTLLWLQSALVGMRQIDVDQIGEKKTQVGNAGQAQALQVRPQIRPVVLLAKYIAQSIKGLAILLRKTRPGLFQAIDTGTLHGRNDGEQRVQIVKLVEFFGHLFNEILLV